CSGTTAQWHIESRPDQFDEDGFEWFHGWTTQEGQELMKTARKGQDYLLECLGLARFRIDFGKRRITPVPLAGCEQSSLVHLLLDQVLPRAVCHGGRLVMHASAVRLRDGRIIAFSGPSGRGKSTLALALSQAGHEVITDDCLLLEQGDGHIRAIPAYPSMRLWPDSLAALAGGEPPEGAQVSDMAHYTHKKQLKFAQRAKVDRGGEDRLSAFYLLAAPDECDKGGAISVKPVSGSTAIMAMIEALFALDVRDRAVIESNFRLAGAMAGAVPLFSLAYPRDFSLLPRVVEKLDSF
ncbi:MAG: hypothetical protein HKN57_08795, partial [Xanthomonadales bacterium]|nr:hypothetical protein [Xanthomonadales bacterium]